MDKYIPCTHCVGQDCEMCDYNLHKKAIEIIKDCRDKLKEIQDFSYVLLNCSTILDVLEMITED